MKKYNVSVIFDKTQKKLLMCKREKEPFKGKLNIVGGKVEPDESEDEAAYRELYEETGISKSDINLTRVLDFKYYLSNIELEVYCGFLKKDVILKEEINKLLWVDRSENFCDTEKFAGENNIEHIIRMCEIYKDKLLK